MDKMFEMVKKHVEDKLPKMIRPYAVMLGSNMYIGNDGILKYRDDGGYKEFFKVRQIYRQRSLGSYLAVNVDIKDGQGKREVKLHKNKPVVVDKTIKVNCNKTQTIVTDENQRVIIKVEQIDNQDDFLPRSGPVRAALDTGKIPAIIRITGDFYVGKVLVEVSYEHLSSRDGGSIGGCFKIADKGDFLILHPDGAFSF